MGGNNFYRDSTSQPGNSIYRDSQPGNSLYRDSQSGSSIYRDGSQSAQAFGLPSLFPDQFNRLQSSQDYRLRPVERPPANMDDKDLSPRAKVTLDGGKLQIEFNVKDYKPE